MLSARYSLRVGTGLSCAKALGVDGVSRLSGGAFGTRLISAKNLWILPKTIKESVDLPDFVKESVSEIQILCTFQARFEVCPKLISKAPS